MTIFRYEEKLKRTYFHVKPLDQKQLRVWDQYLDWQVSQQDHQRTGVLFERCLIPCALYEQFWAKYARYLERAHKEATGEGGAGTAGSGSGFYGRGAGRAKEAQLAKKIAAKTKEVERLQVYPAAPFIRRFTPEPQRRAGKFHFVWKS